MTQETTPEPYRDRRTWPLAVESCGSWRIKPYAISASGQALAQTSIDAAWKAAAAWIAQIEPKGPAGGFLILHQGTEALWLLIDLWQNDILHHHLMRAPLSGVANGQLPRFEPGPRDGTMACVWEMQVMMHEREAWVRHVMKPAQPQLESYLADRLEIDPR